MRRIRHTALFVLVAALLVGVGGATAGAATSVAAARQEVQSALAAPTHLGVTTPLKTVPPKGKTVVFLQCEQDTCGYQGQGIAAAAKAIGWTEKTLNFQETNPATLVSALNQALQYKPVGVFFAGIPYSLWSSVVPAYKKAGVIIVPTFIPDVPTNSVVPSIFGGNIFSTHEGETLGNFVAIDSKQKANVLLVTVPEYPTFIPVTDSFQTTLSSVCPKCGVTTLKISIAQLLAGQLVPAVISALKTHPSTSYVVSVDGSFIPGLPAALHSAGITKVKIISARGTVEDQENVINGTESATTGFGLRYGGWLDVDAALRHVEGMSISSGDGGIPEQLLTKASIGKPTTSYDLPTNYEQQFLSLWKVG